MSVLIYGRKICGKVDRVPGLCHVATMFFHIDHVPVFPLKSYVVIEGSEQGENFRGKETRLSGRSVLAGYLRGWLGIATIVAAMVGSYSLSVLLVGKETPSFVPLMLGGLALVGSAYLFVLLSSRRAIHLVLGALMIGSVVACLWAAQAAKVDPGFRARNATDLETVPLLLLAAGSAFVYTLARLLNRASHDRARALAGELGLDPSVVDPLYETDRIEANRLADEPSPWRDGFEASDRDRARV